MKKAILILLVLLILVVGVVPVHAQVSHGKVTICKNGVTRLVNSQSGARQVTNGNATYGACP